jgi:divalent metal cation (Fe/Co/Zn/Cd) transporter
MSNTLLTHAEAAHDKIVLSFDEITSRQGERLPALVHVKLTDRLSIHEICEIMDTIRDRLSEEGPKYFRYEISLGVGGKHLLRLDVERTSTYNG